MGKIKTIRDVSSEPWARCEGMSQERWDQRVDAWIANAGKKCKKGRKPVKRR